MFCCMELFNKLTVNSCFTNYLSILNYIRRPNHYDLQFGLVKKVVFTRHYNKPILPFVQFNAILASIMQIQLRTCALTKLSVF